MSEDGRKVPEGHPLRRLFRKLTESSLESIGLRDDELVVYISDLLVNFVRTENLYRLRNAAGERLVYLVDMMLVAGEATQRRRREVCKHIGDYSLFILGLFPETLRRPRRPRVTGFYVAQGKKSYRTVAEIDCQRPTAPLFRKLSDKFECCIKALSLEREYLQDPVCQYISRQMGWK